MMCLNRDCPVTLVMMRLTEPSNWRFLWAALVLLLVGAPRVSAADAHYLLIFSFHHQPSNHKDLAHSFATFVRVANDGPTLDPGRGCLEVTTLSWLPASLNVKCKRLRSEPGINLDLAASLCWGEERGLCLSLWGPYEIQKCLYDDALVKHGELEAGCLRYKAIDAACRTAEVSNCIHAITDLVMQTAGRRLCPPCWGESASYFIAQACASRMIEPSQNHDWLLERLGLANRPLTRRRLEDGNPNPNAMQRRFQDAISNRLLEKRQR